MGYPLVSVVIPAFNRATYITRALRSVQNQTFRDLEIIVVNDGSTDNTEEIVTRFASSDHRVRWISHPINKGAQAARNTGARVAMGNWIAYQDSDDEWLPNSLELRLAEAERSNARVVHSECYINYSDTNQTVLFGIHPLIGNIYKEILSAPGPVFPALLIHSDALKQIKFLDEAIVSHQEWDTCIKLAREYEFGFVKEPTFIYYRRNLGTISSSTSQAARGYEQIVLKHKNEIKSQVGRQVLSQHYANIAILYARDLTGDHAELIYKNFSLAISNYPSPWHIYHLFKYLLGFYSRTSVS